MKEYKNSNELLEYIISKGVSVKNKEEALSKIKTYSYYSIINTYKDVFKNVNNEYKKNVSFDEIYALFEFDKNLRSIFLKYLLEIEMILKSLLAETLSSRYGIKKYLIKENFDKINEIRNYVRNFFEGKDGVEINSPKDASPYVLSLSFCGVRGETLVHVLEGDDVIIGTGSACSSKKGALNRTLEEMGKTKEENEGAVRISFSKETTLDEVKQACNIIYDSYLKLKEKLK